MVLPITERYFTGKGDDDRVSLELIDWLYVAAEGSILSTDPDYFRFSGWSTVLRALLEAPVADWYYLDSEMVEAGQDIDQAL